MISITRSTASPPICNPQLPPATVIGAGALQPDLVRQVATPLPWFPPIPRPILSIEGTTAIHCASPRTLSGIPLSGVDMISFSTFAALSRRLAMSDLTSAARSEEHTSELQSQSNLVCRLLLEKKKESIRQRQRTC